jgi:acyl carrier protein
MEKFLKNIKDQFEDTNMSISIEDKLVQIEGYDSMTALMIISMLEEEYNLLISSDDLNDEVTLKMLFNKIQ